MTREEREDVIQYLKNLRLIQSDNFMKDGISKAIEALKQEPCNDCISREEVKQVIRGLATECAFDRPSFDTKEGYKVIPTKYHKGYEQALIDIEEKVKALPPVQPKQKTGHWIKSEYGNMITTHRYYCSECGGKHTVPNTGEWIEVFDYKYPYCPLCGAKMNEGVEE